MSTPNIYQTLLKAMEKVGYVQKTATIKMAQGTYKAVTHDKVTSEVRGALMEQGVIAFPVLIKRETGLITVKKEYNGTTSLKEEMYTKCDLVYRFQNVDDKQDFVDVPSIGDGQDAQDKSAGKALSMAVKNAILKALMLETGENEEDRSDAMPTSQTAAPAKSPVVAQSKRVEKPVEPPRLVNPQEVATLASLIEKTASDTRSICEHYGVGNLLAMNVDQYDQALILLNKKMAKMEKNQGVVDENPLV
jgi:hypothetical protein